MVEFEKKDRVPKFDSFFMLYYDLDRFRLFALWLFIIYWII